MPRNCSLQMDVYNPASLLPDAPSEDEIAWSVSTDPDHPFPYLVGPRQYAEQEIDTIACTASIGQIEVGVMDVPTDPDDQNTGWMTARIHDVLGCRCRLRRYVDATIGWVTISDGPAGAPKMDASYAGYRWVIRDTRDTERKMVAFADGSVTSIVPRGSIYGWGHYEDGAGPHVLLPATLDNPMVGVMNASEFGYGLISVENHLSGGSTVDDPLIVDDARLVIDEDMAKAMTLSQVGANAFIPRNADVIWRKVGETVWNVSRPRSTVAFPQPFAGYTDARLDPTDEKPVQVLQFVSLYYEPGPAPAGFPASDDLVEFIIRYRGPASPEFPYYVEGNLGTVLMDFYTGVYSNPLNTGIAGMVYDPVGIDDSPLPTATIRFDPAAFTGLTEHVILRQTETVEDGRAFTEASLYQPSGWVPALDSDGRISPIFRGRPASVDPALKITNAKVVPNSGWNTGTKTVSSIEYNYNRYFIPAADSGFETEADGIAIRSITVEYDDADSKRRYGDNPETFDATAFSAIGTDAGLNLPGVTEQAELLAQLARFDVLERFRAGVQAIAVMARRSHLPTVRVGDWIPWDLSWLPSRTTGLRGSEVDAAQIVSIRDDNCVWRTLTLEESTGEGAIGGEPGDFSDLTIDTDDFEPGYFTDLGEIDDTADA